MMAGQSAGMVYSFIIMALHGQPFQGLRILTRTCSVLPCFQRRMAGLWAIVVLSFIMMASDGRRYKARHSSTYTLLLCSQHKKVGQLVIVAPSYTFTMASGPSLVPRPQICC